MKVTVAASLRGANEVSDAAISTHSEGLPRALFALAMTLIIGIPFYSHAQNHDSVRQAQIDSIHQELQGINDIQRVDALNLMSSIFSSMNVDSARVYGEYAVELADSIGYLEGTALGHNYIGVAYYVLGEYDKTIASYFKCLDTWTTAKNENGVASILNEIGTFYKRHRETGEANDFFLKSLHHAKLAKNYLSISTSLNNIGIVFEEKNELDSAMLYYRNSQKLKYRIGDMIGVSYTMNDIAGIFTLWKQYDSSLVYLEAAMEIREKLGDANLIAITHVNMAELYVSKAETAKKPSLLILAMEHIMICREEAMKSNYLDLLRYTYKIASDTYMQMGDFKTALADYKLFTLLQDSLFNEAKSKEIGKLEARHEFETAETERKQIELEELKMVNAAIGRRNNLQYSGILIFMVLVFAGVFALGKIKIPIRLAEGLIFFSFLLFFEFSMVLLDPYIDKYSSGAPAISLAFNAVLAALIFPLHSFFESKFKKRLQK